MRFSLNRLWVDSDGMLEVQVFLEGSGYAATQDIYVFPATLHEFAQKLQSFPSLVSDESVLEIGSTEADAYCWLKLRAYVFDGCGHSALELSVKKNGAPQVCAQSRFSVLLEVAALNRLGKLIEDWAAASDVALVFEGNTD